MKPNYFVIYTVLAMISFTGKQATLESNGKTYNELLNDNQAKNTH